MDIDVLEIIIHYVSNVEDYVCDMYSDNLEELLDDIRDLDCETKEIKRFLKTLVADNKDLTSETVRRDQKEG